MSCTHAGFKREICVFSDRAHLILPYHVLLDSLQEEERGNGGLGTTGRGIGPTYVDKVSRKGIRAGDLRTPTVSESKVAHAAEHIAPILGTARPHALRR